MSELTSQEVWSKCLNVIKDNVKIKILKHGSNLLFQ